jgi:hypothetical protein
VTNSSVVVSVGSLQAENGFLETSSQGQSVLDGPESLVRFGIAKRTELCFPVPDYFYNLSAGGGSGFGDFAFGVKQQLGPTPGKFDVSVILFLSFPTGANGVSSGGYDPGLQVPWSRAFSTNWTAGMFSVYWPTQGCTRNVIGESTFLLDRQLTKPWDAFVEYAGDFPEVGGPRHLLHLGTALKITSSNRLTSILAWACRRLRWITWSESAIPFAFRPFAARQASRYDLSPYKHTDRGTRMLQAGREGTSTFGTR